MKPGDEREEAAEVHMYLELRDLRLMSGGEKVGLAKACDLDGVVKMRVVLSGHLDQRSG